jgi:hypothetical protein
LNLFHAAVRKAVPSSLVAAVAIAALPFGGNSPGAQVNTQTSDPDLLVQFQGDANDDWRLQLSTDFIHWTTLTNFGVLLSGKTTNAPWRSVGPRTNAHQFYRGLKTSGLFDPAVFHTVNLAFTQANWGTLLANGRSTGSNVYCSLLTLDNGATNVGVGARYKGNTSYTRGGTKKSINLELDWTDPTAKLMGYTTINLNNAAGDETIMREPVYFTVMSRYATCPKGAMARVHINGSLWGVYSLVQQENGQLVSEHFPSNDGDRWRTPNAPGGGGGFSGSNAALAYLNSTNVSTYQNYYDLRTTNSPTTTAWQRLINAIYVLNTTPANQLRDKVEEVLGVDDWLWFLAIENIFADDDSYWNKGADYSFYYAPEDGRIYPVEHDGNEALSVTNDVTLSPVQGATSGNRPVLQRLLSIPELRQRYLAHMRAVLQERYHPSSITPLIDEFHALSIDAIMADPNKGFTMTAYTNDLRVLKNFVTNRYNFLTNHAELRPLPPTIVAVFDPVPRPKAAEAPFVTAQVAANGTNGIDSVWLYYRDKNFGRFSVSQMFDDGAHGDGAPDDGVFGGPTTNYPAGHRIHYYVEARSANAVRAASFHPARAERDTHAYRVAVTTASNSPVVINELMASNTGALADPQGEYDDWIELHNLTDQDVDLTGRYLSDEPNNPRKWAFPAGTTLPPDGYVIVWADEDGPATPGLHASFKLSADGEEIFLTDTDANYNAVLDSVTFGPQEADRSYGRTAADADVWSIMTPTPGAANR